MKLTNIESATNYEKVFLSSMQVDIREKMQNSDVFIILRGNSKDDAISCKDAIVMRDVNGLCTTKKGFDNIDFEIINNDEFEKLMPEYFKGKCICNVIPPINIIE